MNCTTIECLNKALTKQFKAIGQLAGALKNLNSVFKQSLLFAPVTQYGDMETTGYLWWTASD